MPIGKRVAIIDEDRFIRERLERELERGGFIVRSASDGLQALGLIGGWSPDIIVIGSEMPPIEGHPILPMLRQLSAAPMLSIDNRSGSIDALVARLCESTRRGPEDPVLTWRSFELRTRSRRVWRNGTALALSEREFDLFAALVREPRRVFHKQRLFELVWGRDSRAASNVVEVYVSYVRAKVDAIGEPSFIRTVRSLGYGLR